MADSITLATGYEFVKHIDTRGWAGYVYNLMSIKHEFHRWYCVSPPEGIPASDGVSGVVFQSTIRATHDDQPFPFSEDPRSVVSYYPEDIPGNIKLPVTPGYIPSLAGFMIVPPPGSKF